MSVSLAGVQPTDPIETFPCFCELIFSRGLMDFRSFFQVSNVQEKSGHRFPFPHHYILSSQLSRRL